MVLLIQLVIWHGLDFIDSFPQHYAELRLQEDMSMIYYLKKALLPNLLAVICLLVENVAKVGVSLTLMYSFQQIINGNLKSFLFMLTVMVLLWILIFLISILRTICQNRAIYRMNNLLRCDMAATMIQRNYQDFHAQKAGAYLSQLTTDINEIRTRAWFPLYNMVGTVTLVVASMITLARLHWSLLVACTVTALLMVLIPKLFDKRLILISSRFSKKQEEALSSFKDFLAGYDILCLFGRTTQFKAGIFSASRTSEQGYCDLNIAQSKIFNGLSMLNMCFQGLVMALMGYLSIKGFIIQSALLGGNTICGNIYNGIQTLLDLRLSIVSAKPYFKKITIHAEEKQSRPDSIPFLKTSITVNNVSFCYDEKKPILKDASFRFEKGKKYALTGPSGCGKSTLLKLLLGWLPNYTGTILFDDTDIRTVTPAQLQQQMSYIEQNVFLFNTTIRENITLGENFTEEQLQKAIQGSALAADLAAMPDGLDTVAGEDGSNLSGGQKQRVAIARALIHDRSILLVDEGTSALDQKNADLVEKSLLANPDLTLILISHHLSAERRAQFDHVYELTPAAY